MAANYWASTQRLYWQFSKQKLAETRRRVEDEDRALVQQYPLPERRFLSIYFNQQIVKLGRRIQVRQQALATAQLYVRRFYTKVEIRQTNPYLVMATAVYLACKMEECPQHIRLVVSEARTFWPDFIPTDTSKLGECEFTLISEMNSQLIVHQPYRSLSDLQSTFSLAQDEVALAWSIINDHYLTDLPLLYPPHIVALTAVFLAVVLKPTQTSLHAAATSAVAAASAVQAATNSVNSSGNGFQSSGSGGNATSTPQTKVQELVSWLAESDADVEAIIDCTQELISLYDVWDQYNEKVCKEQIARYVKARGIDR
ncbi:MAG: RNA polymerase II holoenzyme cyclin-like subunit [Trichoglossum hirsutum]|nr:MAG: RNA polymerase II holoenzyme cyclin-like subunit [Trichoglossum hirsutum]